MNSIFKRKILNLIIVKIYKWRKVKINIYNWFNRILIHNCQKMKNVYQVILYLKKIWHIFINEEYYFGACVSVKLLQLCPTLWDPVSHKLQDFFVNGILQARMLEWVGHALLQGILLTQELNPCLLHLLHWRAGSNLMIYMTLWMSLKNTILSEKSQMKKSINYIIVFAWSLRTRIFLVYYVYDRNKINSYLGQRLG